MKNKAFSLAELMVALSIMAVISAILIPSLTKVLPNDNKYKLKAAYSILSNTVNELINDGELYPNGNFQNASSGYFCNNFANKLNTTYTDGCSKSPSTPAPLDIITTNGMRWYGVKNGSNYASTTPNSIIVDINGEAGPDEPDDDWFEFQITKFGKISIDEATYPNGVAYLKED